LNESVKLLTLLLQNDEKTRKRVIEKDMKLEFLYDLFKDISSIEKTNNLFKKAEIPQNSTINMKKFNETLINNVTLSITFCFNTDNGLADRMASTNIIMDLLYLTRDGHGDSMRKNCAILIAKLAKNSKK
jgi:hypothetical protein